MGVRVQVKLRRETCESIIRGADKPSKDLFHKVRTGEEAQQRPS